ncbi:MAG: efflux RND transporter periplasmic adaptor subunit [Gammaproteobacteria bacterium]|nr:efflux RND transporter periplasmic adaptor subunit [Gammaproteobacteria bacterium]
MAANSSGFVIARANARLVSFSSAHDSEVWNVILTKLLPTPRTGIPLKFATCLGLALLLAACNKSPAPGKVDAAGQAAVPPIAKADTATYVCPMHPNIVREHPGHCPICGMALVKKEVDQHAQAQPVVALAPDVIQKLGVRTAAVTRGSLWQYINTVGYVDYDRDLVKDVWVATAGWVENLSRRRVGLTVEKGELLLELYSPEFLKVQKDFIAAQKKDKSGVLEKYGKRRESVDARDALRYMGVSESLQNEIARAGKPKFRLPIYSPMHGVIIRHNVENHQFIPPYYPIFTIADTSSVWVEADVYEHQMEYVRRGLSAEIEVKALPGKRYNGQVNYIYPELDPRTRTLRVRLLVPNTDGLLKPNMFADVRIYGGPKRDLLKIPREALIVTGKRESVILDRGNGRFQPVDVVSGMRSEDEVEILSGLKAGDKVVTSGQFLIDSEANLQASFARFGEAK